MVKMLLEAGAAILMASDDEWTPLNAASGNGHVEVVELILDKGADVTATDDDG